MLKRGGFVIVILLLIFSINFILAEAINDNLKKNFKHNKKEIAIYFCDKKVVLKVMQIFTDYNNFRRYNYINVSQENFFCDSEPRSQGGIFVIEKLIYAEDNNLINSSVVNTGIKNCSLKCGSFDQIGILSSIANDKKGTSVLCEISLSALSSKEGRAFLNSIIPNNKEIFFRNFSFVILDLEQIISEYEDNSFMSSLGANNSILFSFNNLFVNESDLNKENTMLVSTTNFIYNSLCFFDITCLNSLPSLMQSWSVNSEFLKSSSNFSNISSCFILLTNASLANADQFSHANLSIFFLISSGTDNVIDTMLIFSIYDTFTNVLHIFKPFDSINYNVKEELKI